MKKSGFWTFWLAFVPGAGHMYQDYMKRGISIMGLFGLEIVLMSTFNSALFTVAMLITWCAAFFDTFHLAHMDAAARAAAPDDWLWNTYGHIAFTPGRHTVVGAVCIVLGAWLCLEQLPRLLAEFGVRVYWLTRMIERYLPPLLLAGLLIGLGLRLVTGGSAGWRPPVVMDDWMPYEAPQPADAVPTAGAPDAPAANDAAGAAPADAAAGAAPDANDAAGEVDAGA